MKSQSLNLVAAAASEPKFGERTGSGMARNSSSTTGTACSPALGELLLPAKEPRPGGIKIHLDCQNKARLAAAGQMDTEQASLGGQRGAASTRPQTALWGKTTVTFGT